MVWVGVLGLVMLVVMVVVMVVVVIVRQLFVLMAITAEVVLPTGAYIRHSPNSPPSPVTAHAPSRSPFHHFTSHQMHQHMHQSTIRAIRHSPTIHRRAYTILHQMTPYSAPYSAPPASTVFAIDH